MRLSLTIRRRAIRAIMSLPPTVLRAIAGGTTIVDGQELDVQLAAGLRFADRFGPRIETLDPPHARRHAAALLAPFEPAPARVAAVHDERGPDGLPIRVFVPRDAGGGLIVLFHGGGGVIGSVDSYDGVARLLANRAGHAVASVDYRLAPEHPHPAAIDDAIAAWAWLIAHAPRWGADPQRVAVTGDSFGGFLAMHVARAATAAARPRLAALLYPLLDLTLASPSYQTFAEGYGLTLPMVEYFRNLYAPDPASRAPASPLAWPALRELPPILVVTAGFDPLRDEARTMVARLRDAGVAVEHQVHAGLIHGFVQMTGVCDAADLAFTQLADALGAAVAARPRVARGTPAP